MGARNRRGDMGLCRRDKILVKVRISLSISSGDEREREKGQRAEKQHPENRRTGTESLGGSTPVLAFCQETNVQNEEDKRLGIPGQGRHRVP